MTLYRGATADNECPLMVEKDLPTCGRSRFGCWVCTMVEKDKSMEAMISNDEEKAWMTPLLDFRNEFGNEEADRDRRSFRRMGGQLQGSYGRLYHGPYKKEVREAWLKRLLEMQVEINQNGPEEFSSLQLITIPELQEIRKIWVHEKHEFDDSLPIIYEQVIHRPFYDPEWISSETYGKEEWDSLKSVCESLLPDEKLAFELMYTLIDVENNAMSNNSRKGILETLEKTIEKTFYRDEADATEYYMKKLSRKKEMGGKYDQKFLDNTHLSEEDLPEENNDEGDIIG